MLLVTALLSAGACTKKAAQPSSHLPASPAAAPASKPLGGPDSLPPGFDLGKLDEFKRKVFDQVVSREASVCGKGESLLNSAKRDSGCRASFYAVRYVARLADAGLSETEIVEKLVQRFRQPRVPYIDVSQAPSKGNPAGRVTLVEFADYQCGHCKQAQALMHALLAEYPKDLVFYFKHFPLSGHVNALNAALGATAAQKQDKFWQFADKVWENSEQLTPALLESLAKEIGLDFTRWYADVGAEEVRERVQRDRTEGRSLQIRRTPAIFINGRLFADEPDLPGLKDWIDEELGR